MRACRIKVLLHGWQRGEVVRARLPQTWYSVPLRRNSRWSCDWVKECLFALLCALLCMFESRSPCYAVQKVCWSIWPAVLNETGSNLKADDCSSSLVDLVMAV